MQVFYVCSNSIQSKVYFIYRDFGGENMNTKKIALGAMCIALGVVMPIMLHGFPNAGSILLPMHIPVLLSGVVCGPILALFVGLLTPVVSTLTTGMPAVGFLPVMAIELAAYGLITAVAYRCIVVRKDTIRIVVALVLGMVLGRIVYGFAFIMIINPPTYTIEAWYTSLFVSALPGIVIQLVLIPALCASLKRAKLI